MSAPRAPAMIAAPGEDSMLSSSPDSSALCAIAPFFRLTISILSPCLAAKSRSPTISMKPASPFGSITPCLQGLSSCACAPAANSRTAAQAVEIKRMAGGSGWPPAIIGGLTGDGNAACVLTQCGSETGSSVAALERDAPPIARAALHVPQQFLDIAPGIFGRRCGPNGPV